MDTTRRFDKWYPVLILIAVHFAFATLNILLKKVVVDQLNHLVFITYRLTVATIFLAPLAFFLERKSQPKLTFTIAFHIFINAILGASLTQYLFMLGIQYTSATFSCAFLNMVPVITFIMSLPFGLESVDIKSSGGRAKVIGTLVCVGGATLLTLYKGMPLFNNHSSHSQINTQLVISRINEAISGSREGSGKWTSGCLALVAGTILWSSWFLLQSNIGKRYPLKYSSTTLMMFFGAIQSLVLSLFIDRDLSIWILKGKIEILTILYAGVFGSGLCFVGMSWCVKRRGPAFSAAFSPLVQIVAAFFDVPFLHEPLHLGSLVGSAVVVMGLYILLWGKNKEMQDSQGVTKVDQENEKIDLEGNAVAVIHDPISKESLTP